jgi:vancomycin resistance protein VanJ
MPTTERASNPGFWRCSRCNTPNPWASYLTCCMGCGAARPAPGQTSNRAEASEPIARPLRARSPWLLGCVVGYGLIILVGFMLERVVGDAWWPGAAILLSPRWSLLVPILPLGLWALFARRWTIAAVVAIEAVFILGPLMGFAIPWGRLRTGPAGPSVRIMTFNRGNRKIDAARFARYIDRQKIDVICFQDFGNLVSVEIDPALAAVLDERGWHRDASRMIASRFPIVAEIPRPPENNLPEERYTMSLSRARLEGPEGREFVVGSVHMPTLRPGFRKLGSGDIRGFRMHLDWWASECGRVFEVLAETKDAPILVAGDFNNAAEASGLSTVRDHALFKSAFEEAGLGWGYTRPAAIPWARIDHILASYQWKVTQCWVGPDFGSDHRTLVAEVVLPAHP